VTLDGDPVALADRLRGVRGQDPERDGLDVADLAVAGGAAGRQVDGEAQVAAGPAVGGAEGVRIVGEVPVTVIMRGSWAAAGRSGRLYAAVAALTLGPKAKIAEAVRVAGEFREVIAALAQSGLWGFS
jgi:hypothetical protein